MTEVEFPVLGFLAFFHAITLTNLITIKYISPRKSCVASAVNLTFELESVFFQYIL